MPGPKNSRRAVDIDGFLDGEVGRDATLLDELERKIEDQAQGARREEIMTPSYLARLLLLSSASFFLVQLLASALVAWIAPTRRSSAPESMRAPRRTSAAHT